MAIPTNKSIKTVTYNGTTIPIYHKTQSKSTTTNGTVSPDSGYDGLSSVTVNVPTGTARSSSDLTVSGATVSVPAGLYSSAASKSVASGSAGTPTASKGTVSNNSVTVTTSVTNTTGYITGGTKTGTGVSVSASELVSGNKALSSSTSDQTSIDVTNYSTVSISKIASGSAGTPTATKGAVSNHAVTVTPSVTNTTGYITGGTKTGTGVSVSASELVSGTANIVTNGSVDVTNLATASVNVPASAVTSGTKSITTTDSVDVTTYKNAQVSDANLVAGNIANGVSVLGILGTYNPTKVTVGTVSLSSTATSTISHGLGVIPDLVIYINTTQTTSSSTPVPLWGISKKTLNTNPSTLAGQTCVRMDSSSTSQTKYTSANLLTSTSGNGAPYNATSTQFTIGSMNTGLLNGTYMWIAMIL